MTRAWDVDALTDRIKAEITSDVTDGIVPPDVASFSALHDWVDANGYGGTFEADAPAPAELTDTLHAAWDQVDAWIRSGALAAIDEELDADTVEALGLDNTGRDFDPRFPYRTANLTRRERSALIDIRSQPDRI